MEVKLGFTETYEYIEVEGDTGRVGISKEASDKLGDIYLVELPEVGQEFKKGEEVGVLESIKAAYDIYSPLSGKVVEVNDEIVKKPELLSEDPMGAGWMFKIEIKDKNEIGELMDSEEFKRFVNEDI